MLSSSTALVACVAVNAVVDVPIRVGVVEIGCVAASMARGGATEHRVIRGVGMARSAVRARVAMIGWEEGVVARGQCRRHPGSRGVASNTRCGPSCGDVIGICGASEILLVAGIAIGRSSYINVVDVA